MRLWLWLVLVLTRSGTRNDRVLTGWAGAPACSWAAVLLMLVSLSRLLLRCPRLLLHLHLRARSRLTLRTWWPIVPAVPSKRLPTSLSLASIVILAASTLPIGTIRSGSIIAVRGRRKSMWQGWDGVRWVIVLRGRHVPCVRAMCVPESRIIALWRHIMHRPIPRRRRTRSRGARCVECRGMGSE